MQLLGTFPRPAPTGMPDGLYGIDEFFKDHRVVDVGGSEHYRQWDAPSIRSKVALGALLSFISVGLLAVFGPRTTPPR